MDHILKSLNNSRTGIETPFYFYFFYTSDNFNATALGRHNKFLIQAIILLTTTTKDKTPQPPLSPSPPPPPPIDTQRADNYIHVNRTQNFLFTKSIITPLYLIEETTDIPLNLRS